MITELTKRFDVPGFTLAWDAWGEGTGPPLVLIHGFSGSAHDFALQIPALAEHRRVLAIDHRGHGLSSNSLDESTYTIDHIVDDVIDWLDHTAIAGPFDILGHSMGGRVAMRIALARRDLINSLILMDTTAWDFGPDNPEIRELVVGFFESITSETPMGNPPPSPEDPLIAAGTTTEWQDLKAARSAAVDPMALRALGLALFANDLLPVDDRLGDIDAPVTVIAGEHDHPFVDHAPALAEAVVHGECSIINGAYHSPQLTHPSEWVASVEAHLARGLGQ